MAEVGEQAPNFTLTDHNQEQVTLSQLRGKNVVLSVHVNSFTSG